MEIFLNDFETMIAETDNQSKLEKLKKNKDESFTVTTSKHIPKGFALAIFYSGDNKCRKNEYFRYRGGNCLAVFAEKMDKILLDFAI